MALAPKEAMQFGRDLHRVMQTVVNADARYGPIYLSKIDIADGFYRVWLQSTDIAKLGVALPTVPGQPLLVAFPLTLPMGWVESPPYFTTITETACNLASMKLRERPRRPLKTAHRLEAVAATPPDDTVVAAKVHDEATQRVPHKHGQHKMGRPPVAAVDVYVDDFILLAQTQHRREQVLRITLNAIDCVFCPLMPHI